MSNKNTILEKKAEFENILEESPLTVWMFCLAFAWFANSGKDMFPSWLCPAIYFSGVMLSLYIILSIAVSLARAILRWQKNKELKS